MAGSQYPRTESGLQGAAELAAGSLGNLSSYQRLIARTVDAFGDEFKASRWLSLPNRDLNGETPLQAAQKHGYDVGILEPILIRLEHGIDY
jgi:uncharacterized protein (DUF2384 family)